MHSGDSRYGVVVICLGPIVTRQHGKQLVCCCPLAFCANTPFGLGAVCPCMLPIRHLSLLQHTYATFCVYVH
jgi:hypothetical protein